ncbi:MAG: hypothetical protein JXA46_18370 [Dehalococcoidales bacterium]|nr:hypothetical protein [Dehalococcoidales bacterium]
MRKDLRQRIAEEFNYAVTKMQEVQPLTKRLFYFSVFFGESQRMLNLQWDRELVLLYTVTQHVYTQINGGLQNPAIGNLPINWSSVFDKLTQASSELAACYAKPDNASCRAEICQILERLAEIAYAVSGNGSYLYEKGCIKF